MASSTGLTYIAGSSFWTAPGRSNLAPGSPPAATTPKFRWNGSRAFGTAIVTPTTPGDWSDSNPPWAYTDPSVFTATWPAGTPIVPIQTGSSDFYTNLANTVAAAGRRVVVDIRNGGVKTVYHLNSFRPIGTSGDILYAFGFWFPNLQGLLGDGPDITFIQMDANSLTSAQITKMGTSPYATSQFNALQTGFCRFDGTNPSSPVLLAGITFRSDDQPNITSVQPDVPIFIPQPAPHQGVTLFYNTYYDIGYCRFQAAGRAMTSQPSFEMANLTSAQSHGVIHNTEFDGRISPELNPRQPRRCGPLMGNNEGDHELIDVWLHHSNVSRYAINDQNANTTGTYVVTRTKAEFITNNQNTDPALNNGQSLGGWTNASAFGWESCNGTITVTDAFVTINNASVSGSFPAHFQLTTVGTRNPQGGRMHIKGGTFHHTAFSQLDGFITFRIATNTFWWSDGVGTTLDVRRSDNTPLTGWNFTGTWPPTAAQIAAAGISPNTHYIYKGV